MCWIFSHLHLSSTLCARNACDVLDGSQLLARQISKLEHRDFLIAALINALAILVLTRSAFSLSKVFPPSSTMHHQSNRCASPSRSTCPHSASDTQPPHSIGNTQLPSTMADGLQPLYDTEVRSPWSHRVFVDMQPSISSSIGGRVVRLAQVLRLRPVYFSCVRSVP